MKTSFDTIILFACLFLAIAIFFSVAFGCAFRKRKEHFENKKNDKNDKNDKKDKKDNGLSKFENKLLTGISAGTITEKQIASYIKGGDFTKENLANMITYVEKTKNTKK